MPKHIITILLSILVPNIANADLASHNYTDYINKKILTMSDDGRNDIVSPYIFKTMKKGNTYKDLPELLAVLKTLGHYNTDADISKITMFDERVENLVKQVQRAYGLKDDGIAGKQLYVNLSASSKLKRQALVDWSNKVQEIQTEAKSNGFDKIIIVNIPTFTLKAMDLSTGEVVLESPVIIGKTTRKTPLFTTNITGIKYNPTWTPPPGIMKADILPRLGKEDDTWIQKHGLIIKNKDGDEIDPVNLTRDDWRTGEYKISQPAGDDNALGLLKFETDNAENIYLHDTNSRKLFDRNERNLSSGCIRVQKWKDLAGFVSGKDTETIDLNLAKNRTYIEKVPKTPVYITYSLADIVEDRIVFYPDVYNLFENEILRGVKKSG